MKKWKKSFAITAITTMVFALAACGNEDAAADPNEVLTPTEAPADPTETPADPTVAPADPTEAPAPTETPAPTEAPVSDEVVINFLDLAPAGYGYEASVADDAMNVTIAGQYQEIQFALPETVDLFKYTKLVIDMTSNNQLDIKLVNPEAELNQYNQLTPFLDYYTADGAIKSPLEISLDGYSNYDLYQINFMAMVNDTELTIKSMTFVK